MSLTRNGKQIFLLRVLSLRRSKFLESQWKSLVELSGENERTVFEFRGGTWCLNLTVYSGPVLQKSLHVSSSSPIL